MELEVYRKDGTKSGEKVKLSPEIFAAEVNQDAIFRAVRAYLDNQRQGTAKVKARQGSSRSPVMVGGGSIFGPEPRDYTTRLPAKIQKLARRSALSFKAKEGQIRIVEDFSFEAPKTKAMVSILNALELTKGKTLLLMPRSDQNVVKSGRNIPRLNVVLADKASTYDLVNNSMLLIQKSAVEVLQNTFKN
jgi:large subunit ribosomal protein L4